VPEPEKTPGELLADKIESGELTIRGIAVALAGPGAEHERIEAQRRYIQKHAGNAGWRPTRPKALELSRATGIPLEALLQPRPAAPPRRQAEQLAARLATLVDRGEELAARLERLLDGQGRHQDVGSERQPAG